MQAAVCERGVYLVLSHTWYLDQGVSGDGEQATAGPGNMIVSEREGSPARRSSRAPPAANRTAGTGKGARELTTRTKRERRVSRSCPARSCKLSSSQRCFQDETLAEHLGPFVNGSGPGDFATVQSPQQRSTGKGKYEVSCAARGSHALRRIPIELR